MQETGLWIKLKAMFDKQQVQKETKEVVDEAQKTLDKKELKLKIEDNLKELKKKLEETRVAYQNLLNQPMNWTTNKQLEALEDQMEDLRNAIKEDEKALNDLGTSSNKLGGIFKNLAGKITALGVATKVFTTLKNVFVDFQDAQKQLVMQTWASGEALKQLTDDMLSVQGKVRQSQGEIAEAVGELNTRLGLTGQELQDFTTKYLKFASVTGQNGKQAIEDNIKMFNIWGVSITDQAEYLDKLAVAGQKTGISVSNLTNMLQQNAPVLQELGFSLDDSIALLSNFEQAWVEASQVLQSMKMWLKNLSENGQSPMEALKDAIQGVQDGTLSLSDAMDIFGARGWVAMYNAIKNGTFALGEMKDALNDVSWAVEQTFSDMETWWDLFGRIWEGAKSEVVDFANDSFNNFKHIVEFNKQRYNSVKELANGNALLLPHLDATTWKLDGVQVKLKDNVVAQRELEKVEKEITETMAQYNDAVQKANDNLKAFLKVKADQSATRADFEATRQKALETASALSTLLGKLSELSNRKMSLKQTLGLEVGERFKSWLNAINSLWGKIKENITNLQGSEYSWKDGGGLGGSLLWGSGSKGKSKAQEMLEDFDKELENTWDDLNTFVKDHQKTYDDLVKQIQKVESEYGKLQGKADDMRHSLEKSVRSYNEQLEKNQTDSLEKLGQRYVELKEKRAEIDNDYLKNKVGEITDKEWEHIRDDGWTFRGYTYSELKDIKELYDEIKVIEENTTEEQRKAEDFTKKTSRAQEILNSMKEKEAELEQKKADAIEKQKIATALMNQEIWKEYIKTLTKNGEEIGTRYYDVENEKWEQIHNVDNIEYAKQLEQQSQELANQKKQLETAKDEEVEILTDATARKTQLEEQYEIVYKRSLETQKKGLDELIQKTQTLINKRREYMELAGSGSSRRAYGGGLLSGQVSLVGENWPEQIIARQSSYVQPRNAGNSYNTVNNNGNTLSINGIEVKYDNMDDMLNALKEKLTYRS